MGFYNFLKAVLEWADTTKSYDLWVGTPEDDLLLAPRGEPDQLIWGDDGNDAIWGGNGKDLLIGGGGDDVLKGGNGKDLIITNGGNAHVLGGNGKDLIFVTFGENNVWGGRGADTIVVTASQARMERLQEAESDIYSTLKDWTAQDTIIIKSGKKQGPVEVEEVDGGVMISNAAGNNILFVRGDHTAEEVEETIEQRGYDMQAAVAEVTGYEIA